MADPLSVPPDAQPVTSQQQVDLIQSMGLSGPPVPQMPLPANVVQTTFDDDSIQTSEFDVYKGRKGHVDRIGILLPRQVTFGRVHFLPERGYYLCVSQFRVQQGQEIPVRIAICCERLDLPRKRFAVPVIHYNTTPDGQLVAPFGFRLKVWRFSEQVFASLRTSNKEFPLEHHDLLVRCEDEQYQKIQLQSCREAIAARPEFQKAHGQILQAYLASLAGKLERAVGRRADAKEWGELLGSLTPAPATVADQPIQDIGDLLKL